jgi:hypothetical protein
MHNIENAFLRIIDLFLPTIGAMLDIFRILLRQQENNTKIRLPRLLRWSSICKNIVRLGQSQS